MRILLRLLPAILLFSACVQIKADNSSTGQDVFSARQSRNTARNSVNYQVEITTQIIGFSLQVNGFAFLTHDGGSAFTSQIPINDWMISGENDITIDISWPAGVDFNPRQASASFRLLSNNTIVQQYRWPVAGINEVLSSYPHRFTDTFRAPAFPGVLLEKGERFNTIPGSDSEIINSLANGLQRALNDRNIESINSLFRAKYADLATARFSTPDAVRAEEEAKFRELFGKDRFRVDSVFGNRFSYFLDNKVIRLRRGSLQGDPVPAFTITYMENGRQQRLTMELYFVKVDDEWVIIRSLIR